MMGIHLKQESRGLARIKDVFSILCPSLYSTQFFHCYNYEWATWDVRLGQEIPVWKAVTLLRIPLAGRPFLTGQAGICRKEETGQLMH